ncbi:MAG TPA: excinuclease ABC subunit UvrA [Actinophytocola sp.]|nr:excinuclease ABC subunit UvrA [Actinophytocola sp.]
MDITVRGAREHNLRDIDVVIPHGRLTVVTGVSGSGKSSLVFDTVAAEARRQLTETFTAFERHRLPSHGRPDVDAIDNLAAAVVVDQKRIGGNSRSTVATVTDVHPLLRLLWSRAARPAVGDATAFSFNDPRGMCPTCQGLGTTRTIDLDELVDRDRSLNEGAIRFPTFHVGGWMWRTYAGSALFDNDKPLREFTDDEWRAFLHGADAMVERPTDPKPVPKQYEGLLPRFERIWLPKDPARLRGRTRRDFDRVVTQGTCPDCAGTRLNRTARSALVDGHGIAEVTALPAEDALEVVRAIERPRPVVDALVAQLERLVRIGLGYLPLDRPTSTLSGGESQRVKTVRHLGSTLTGMLYVFDEPSVGLHPRDVGALVELLGGLRDRGNTVLVVEHDPDVVAAADHVIDLGPGPGRDGGRVVYQGDVAGVTAADTPTGRHLRARTPLDATPRKPAGWRRIRGADRHNLRGVDVDVPTGVLTAVTGVAGSGKSTLVHGYLTGDDVVAVDQGALRGSRRSTPVTYLGMLDPIRALFAAASGAPASLFSANSGGGCPDCRGLGVVHTDLAFLDTMVGTCDRCHGRRFTDEALAHTVRGLTIGDVFDLTAADALDQLPEVRDPLTRMCDVGLGYLTLGQPLTSLSGGERQRLRLATELDRAGAVYVFDEPTTGLHGADVAALLAVFDRLVDRGGSVVVVEHDLDVVAAADHVIDLGPGPGRHGGRVLFTGPPAALARADTPTGRHLAARVACDSVA